MLLRFLPLVGLAVALKVAEISSSDGDAEAVVLTQTKSINVKLNLLENKLKNILKENASRNDLEKLKKYFSISVLNIKQDLATLVQNFSTSSQKPAGKRMCFANENEMIQYAGAKTHFHQICKRITESDDCDRMEEVKKTSNITTLLRVADRVINIKTRFKIYVAIYNDMVEHSYNNIFNLNSYLQKLVYHFIANSYTPDDVIKEAVDIRDNIGKTFKISAIAELRDDILNNCSSSDIETMILQLATTTGKLTAFYEVLHTAIDLTYNSVGALALLDKSLRGGSVEGVCQTVKHVYQHMKMKGHLYHTEINFKLIKLIEYALNSTSATLEELDPCLNVEAELNPSAREIVLEGEGCIQNQLRRELLFTSEDDFEYDKDNRMVFVSANGGKNNDARWSFETDGSNRFWIRHVSSKEYLYSSEIPSGAANPRDVNTNVFTSRSGEKKNRWYFNLTPENGGVRILNEEKRYLYAKEQMTKGDGKLREVAVWYGQGEPQGSVWKIVRC